MSMATIDPLQSGDNFPFKTQRCFIHNKQSWLKGLGGAGNYSLAYFKSVLGVDSDGQGQVLFIGHFDHARDADEIDLRGEGESANYR